SAGGKAGGAESRGPVELRAITAAKQPGPSTGSLDCAPLPPSPAKGAPLGMTARWSAQSLFERGEELGGVVGGVHFTEDCGDFSIGGDDEGAALGAHVFAAIERFFDPHAVGVDDVVRFIDEEGERERVLRDELGVALRGVDADAEDGGAFRKLLPRIA